VAELADAADLKSAGGDTVWVRPPPALQIAFSWHILAKYPVYRGHSARLFFRESSVCRISQKTHSGFLYYNSTNGTVEKIIYATSQ
jgi:hypothetical protein